MNNQKTLDKRGCAMHNFSSLKASGFLVSFTGSGEIWLPVWAGHAECCLLVAGAACWSLASIRLEVAITTDQLSKQYKYTIAGSPQSSRLKGKKKRKKKDFISDRINRVV